MIKVDNFAALKKEMAEHHFDYPNDYKVEGEDHINISNSSTLFLGRFLNPVFFAGLQYPLVGGFRSIQNLLLWLRSEDGDGKIRHLTSSGLKDLPKVIHNRRIANFHAIILLATLEKIKTKPDVVQKIKNLPKGIRVLSYSVNKANNLRLTTSYAHYVVPIIVEVIRSIQKDIEPNWDKFLDVPGKRENGFLETSLAFEFKEDDGDITRIGLAVSEEGVKPKTITETRGYNAHMTFFSTHEELLDYFNKNLESVNWDECTMVPLIKG